MYGDYTPCFTVHPMDYTKAYRSSFMHIQIPGLCQPECGENEYRVAVGRMIALRSPDKPGYSDRLAANQNSLARTFRTQLHRFKLHFERNIQRMLPEESYPIWLHQPHDKRIMRRGVRKDIEAVGTNRGDDDKFVEFKPKPGEMLPAGKKRGVGDMGVLRTDATAMCMDEIKNAWSVPFEYNNLRAVFVKASTKDALREAFKNLIEPEKKIQFYYHSDDSCVGATCSDGHVHFNGDIKACDGSHRRPLFEVLANLLTKTDGRDNYHAEPLKRAFSYLTRDLRMYNKFNRKQRVVYKFKDPRLYSGSVLTTTINNMANLFIALALERRVPDPSLVTSAQFKEAYRLAGEDVGYILKIVDCDCVEDLQFLKHSPCLQEDGSYEPWVNLGTYIRGFGSCHGDLPGRGPLRNRAAAYISGVVESRLNWGKHAFNDAFGHFIKRDVGMTNTVLSRCFELEKSKSHGGFRGFVPNESLCRRYKISLKELDDLCRAISGLRLGGYLKHPVCKILYDVDYG